jgi:hypothetical protein
MTSVLSPDTPSGAHRLRVPRPTPSISQPALRRRVDHVICCAGW